MLSFLWSHETFIAFSSVAQLLSPTALLGNHLKMGIVLLGCSKEFLHILWEDIQGPERT